MHSTRTGYGGAYWHELGAAGRVRSARVCSLLACIALGNQRCMRAARVHWGPACAANHCYYNLITLSTTRRGF